MAHSGDRRRRLRWGHFGCWPETSNLIPYATDIMLADHVMAPRLFMEPDTAATLGKVYSPYRDANYGERVETPYWTRWSHRKKSGSEVASVTTQPVAIR